jgi:hypothetical protein
MGRSKDQLQTKGLQARAGTSPPSPKTPQKVTTVSKNGKKSKSSGPPKYVTSRLEISAVTINMSGRGVLGVTPKYKVDMVETFLKTVPDIVFLQVGSKLKLNLSILIVISWLVKLKLLSSTEY